MAELPLLADDFNKNVANFIEARKAPEQPQSPTPSYVLEKGGSATSGEETVIKAGSGAGAVASVVGGRVHSATSGAGYSTHHAGVAAAGPGGHGVTADCAEPWATEAREMAKTRAESFKHAAAINQELGQEKAKVQQAEYMLGTAAAEIADARGQAERAQQIAE